MTRISAAGRYIIEMDANHWRLIEHDEEGRETVVLTVMVGEPLCYTGEYASTHHLPSGGVLPTTYIRQVVVGWSHEDEAWHLGLLLARDLADARGSRWCEIAWWPDPDLDVFTDFARDAGHQLAQVLAKPLNHVLPRPQKREQEPPLPELPLKVGLWKLRHIADRKLALVRGRKWLFSRIWRLVWYVFWAAVYLALSITTLNSSLALPNAGTMLPSPELLPYLGLAVAAVLGLMALHVAYQLVTSPNRIIVDGQMHRIVGVRGRSERWEKTGNNLCDVYVTQIIRQKRNKRIVQHGELSLRLTNGEFYCVLQQSENEELPGFGADDIPEEENPAQISEDTVTELNPWHTLNDLQAAGLYIAKTLGELPCWYDLRIR